MRQKDKMAKRLLKMAKQIVEGPEYTFYVQKPIKFKPEGSITHASLENAKMIQEAGYRFVRAIMMYDKEKGTYRLSSTFERNKELAVHVFTGFSFGYGGEGPRGLMKFSDTFGLGLDEKKIFGRDDTTTADLKESGSFDLLNMFR